MLDLLNKILEAMRSQNGDLIMKIGDTEFGRVAIKAINNTQRQAGATLLNI